MDFLNASLDTLFKDRLKSLDDAVANDETAKKRNKTSDTNAEEKVSFDTMKVMRAIDDHLKQKAKRSSKRVNKEQISLSNAGEK
jgi:hypothetical protein